MKCSGNQLYTPVYLKTAEAMSWPADEPVFHVLSRDGLFVCRNHPFFTSCVPTEIWPSELAGQKPFLHLRYPRLPRPLIERIVGFFDLVGELHASEAAVLIAWDRETETIVPVVPPQTGTISSNWYGESYPMDLEYEVPPLPPHLLLIGDIHSHVDGPAYASFTDKSDEVHRPGLHLVVGRIRDEPPQFHAEVVADGVRFRVRDLGLVLEGYRHRRRHEVPREWLTQLTVKPWSSVKYRNRVNSYSPTPGSSGDSASWNRLPPVLEVNASDAAATPVNDAPAVPDAPRAASTAPTTPPESTAQP